MLLFPYRSTYLSSEMIGPCPIPIQGFTMRFLLPLSVAVLVASLPQFVSAQSSDETDAVVVKKLAEQMTNATQKGDYKKIVSLTYGSVVEQLGGPTKAFETIKEQMETMKLRGMRMNQFKAGKLKGFASTAQNKFVIVPTQLTLSLPGATIQADSFLLGISSDLGKTWKFVDGAGIATQEQQKKLLPPLPDDFQLPKPKQPKILRD